MEPLNQDASVPLLSVAKLGLTVGRGHDAPRVVDDVSLTIGYNESVGLVGESGCGKTLTLRAVVDLLPARIRRVAGSVNFAGRDLTAHSHGFRSVRGSGIGIVFQDAMTALDPLMKVGRQILEVRREHINESKQESRDHVLDLLQEVGIDEPQRCADSYVYQLSGGMRQRVLIAQALAAEPRLLLCDEPTTALDVLVQRQVIDLLLRLKASRGLSLLFVSHDLLLVSEFCERIAVMYAGEVVEQGATSDVLQSPAHPYVAALKAAIPSPDRRASSIAGIPGSPPDGVALRAGCAYAPRCTRGDAQCTARPIALTETRPDHLVRCIHPLTDAVRTLSASEGPAISKGSSNVGHQN